MGNLNQLPTVVVAHKGPEKNSKIYIDIFTTVRIDDIIDSRKKNSVIPDGNEIIDIGIGGNLAEIYRKKYKL